jgi:hypothetical protein
MNPYLSQLIEAGMRVDVEGEVYRKVYTAASGESLYLRVMTDVEGPLI